MKIRKDTLAVLKPHGGKEEIKAVTEVIKSGWWGKSWAKNLLKKLMNKFCLIKTPGPFFIWSNMKNFFYT